MKNTNNKSYNKEHKDSIFITFMIKIIRGQFLFINYLTQRKIHSTNTGKHAIASMKTIEAYQMIETP